MCRLLTRIWFFFLAASSALAQDVRPREAPTVALPEGALGRIGNIRLRHQGTVHQLSFLPDGTLAALDDRGFFRVWDTTTGNERRSFVQQAKGTQSDAMDARRMEMMMMMRMGGPGRRWGRRMNRYGEEGLPFAQQVFSPDARYLAGTDDEKVQVWDTTTGKVWRQYTFREPVEQKGGGGKRGRGRSIYGELAFKPVAFSADGRLLAVSNLNGGVIQVWDLIADKELHALKMQPEHPVFHMVFFPSSSALAGMSPSQAMIWDLKTGKRVRTYQTSREGMSGFAVSSDGKRLAAASEEDSIVLFDDSSEEEVSKIPGRERGITSLLFSPDGKTLLTGGIDGVVRLFDTTTSKEIKALEGHEGPVAAVAVSPDGKTIASADMGGRIRLWDTAKGKETFENEHAGTLIFATFLAPGTVAVGGADGSVRHAEITGKVVKQFKGPGGERGGVVFSPDGKLLALRSEEKGGVPRLWDVLAGKQLRPLKVSAENIGMIAFTPDGKRLGLASWEDGTLRLCDVQTGEEGPLPAQRGAGPGLLFAPDGRTVVRPLPNGQLSVWELATGKARLRFQGPSNEMNCLVMSPDGRQLASGEGEVIRLWNTATGKVQRALAGHTSEIVMLAYSRDGLRLASGSRDGSVRVWDIQRGEALQHFIGHRDAVRCLAFSADGKMLISGSGDGTALIWDLDAPFPVPGKTASGAKKLEALWNELTQEDAEAAFAAQNALIALPEESVAFLRKTLNPMGAASAEQVHRLIGNLDDRRFPVREQSMRELAKLGGQVGPALRKALEGTPSAEAKQRIQQLLEGLARPAAGSDLRFVRAVDVLEQINTAQARQLLEQLSQGAPGARLTEEAKSALGRLAARPPTAPAEKTEPRNDPK